ncbi:hypothetical protein H072_3386 [Dactylellina haptotyla CBS 200.50]|uniref:Nephrocystin 3-like N-terminal domain-containing protein n=1 Tax=Dactylellina haptotyla (strain CBS 200.50) TaxID=1284197 RepID=S8C4H4_DACHA|nr:hypothetical protein H072_3386 [Dactylellina haptotyla CBS 200.50]
MTAEMGKPVGRKTLTDCFNEACDRFQEEIADPILTGKSDPKKAENIKQFLNGTRMDSLMEVCRELSEKVGEENKAARLLTTLEQLKTAGDAFMGFAPESVSIVWFGISSLIQIGNAKVQTRLLICGTCNSITNIVADCIRWEARMAKIEEVASEINIWESDIPEIVFAILDFLWNARPHLDPSRIKRIGSTVKDLFTKDIEQKAGALIEKYEAVVKIVQSHFEDSILYESFKVAENLDQMKKAIREYANIGSELINAAQKQALLYELGQQQAKLTYSSSYKIHFTSLNDRLDKIIRDRNGRLPAIWLYKDTAYQDWKGDNSQAKLLCLRAPRGHGKSVVMTSVYREITGEIPEATLADIGTAGRQPALLYHFFYKRGEQDIQTARASLEAILHQLLGSKHLRETAQNLVATLDVLAPNFSSTLDSLCETTRKVAELIPVRVYLMIDALDECVDRREQRLCHHLRALTQNSGINIRVIISARDSFDVVSELVDSSNQSTDVAIGESTEANGVDELPDDIQLVDITREKNAIDLEEFLRHDVGEVLQRRISKTLSHIFDLELTRIVDTIHKKAKGDFTLARMIIGTLQQPSKETLDKKIQRLPAAIGEIYMQTIESLTPDEQELIVTTLKWVVWSVTSLTVIEISEHYRDIFKEESKLKEEESTKMNLYTTEVMKLIRKNPYEDPEVKDTAYHLENAGRDFFRLDRNTGLVNVDISIREWIQDDDPSANSNSATQESRGFDKYRDLKGNTVFKFTLTSSFVRYGDSLSELFSKKVAHMSIATDILRALNNASFQKEHMPWLPEWAKETVGQDFYYDEAREALGYDKSIESPAIADVETVQISRAQYTRYEIMHWQDHIRILQTWWTKVSQNDTWWNELLTQLSIFMRPENWYRWNIQRPDSNYYSELSPSDRLAARFVQEPIHVASEFGLHLMVDHLMNQAASQAESERELCPRRESDIKEFKAARVSAIFSTYHQDEDDGEEEDEEEEDEKEEEQKVETALVPEFTIKTAIENTSTAELIAFLSLGLPDLWDWAVDYQELIESMEPSLRVAWLASQLLRGKKFPPNEEVEAETQALSISEENNDDDESTSMASFAKAPEEKGSAILKTIRSIYEKFPAERGGTSLEQDVTDFLAKNDNDEVFVSESLQKLISSHSAPSLKYGEGSICDKPDPFGFLPIYIAARHSATVDTLIRHKANINAIQEARLSTKVIKNTALLSILLEITALDENSDVIEQTLLTSAKALISEVSWEWDVHATDDFQMTPLHYLFKNPTPKTAEKIHEALDICQIIVKLRRIDGGELISAEDHQSEMPLAGAIRGGFKQAVELLLKLGADINDQNNRGQNYFHVLAGGRSTGDNSDITMAQTFLSAGLNCTKPDKHGRSPLHLAIATSKWNLVEFFLQKYEETERQSTANEDHPALSRDKHGCSLLHIFAMGSRSYEENQLCTDLFKRVSSLLSKYADINKLILEPNSLGETPLHLAIRYRQHGIVGYILDISPENKCRNIYGYTALDAISEQVAEELVALSDGINDYGPRLAVSKRIFNMAFQKIPPSSLSHFETILFAIEGKGKELEELKLHDIIKAYNNLPGDEHGWALTDLFSVYERTHLASFCSQDSGSRSQNFARPSGNGRVRRGSKQRYYLENDDVAARDKTIQVRNPYLGNDVRIISDHPIPPSDKSFYFEISKIEHEEKVFFTVDGKIIPVFFTVPPRRYFPFLETGSDAEDLKFNFGNEPFIFKLASDTNWDWDGTFDNKDLSNTEVYWQPSDHIESEYGDDDEDEEGEGEGEDSDGERADEEESDEEGEEEGEDYEA